MLWNFELGFDQLPTGMVGKSQAQLAEDVCLVVGIGIPRG
jgi:hypothetical protein